MRFSLFFLGALTAKPYAFSARPWELSARFLPDPLDSLATPLRLDLRGFQPLRLLPAVELNNPLGEWISDRTRFAYDGFRRQRLANPLLRPQPGAALSPVSWEAALSTLAGAFASQPPGLVAGPLLGPGALRLYQRLAALLGLRPGYLSPAFPPLLPGILAGVDRVLLVGCDLRLRLPLVHLKLRRLALGGLSLLLWAGTDSYPGSLNLGHRPSVLLRLLRGQHRASPLVVASRSFRIFLGEDLPPELVRLFTTAHLYALSHSLSSAPAAPVSSTLSVAPLQMPPAASSPPPLWLLAADGWDWLSPVPAVIYQGHHGDRAAGRSNLVLPVRFPAEEEDWRRDLWGRVHPPAPLASNPPLPGAADVLAAALLLAGGRRSAQFSDFDLGGVEAGPRLSPLLRLAGTPHYSRPANPYRLDSVSRASRPLALAARRLVPPAPNYFGFP